MSNCQYWSTRPTTLAWSCLTQCVGPLTISPRMDMPLIHCVVSPSVCTPFRHMAIRSMILIKARRLSRSGDFGLALIHAAAHISVDPSDLSNDLDPRFTHHFHRSLKVLTQGTQFACYTHPATASAHSTTPGVARFRFLFACLNGQSSRSNYC